MENNTIVFDESSREALLKIMSKGVDSENFIVEIDNPSERVLTKDGVEIKLEEDGDEFV